MNIDFSKLNVGEEFVIEETIYELTSKCIDDNGELIGVTYKPV